MNHQRRLLTALLGACVLLLLGMPLYAQSGLPTTAAITDGVLTLYLQGEPRRVETGMPAGYYSLVWSPDGTQLAYTALNGSPRLMLTDRAGSPPVLVAEGVSFLPVTFTAGSTQIIYTQEDPTQTGQTISGLPAVVMQVLVRGLSPALEAQPVGTILVGVGCGGASPFPMDGIYNTESGFGGSPLTFAAATSGIVYSTSCSGTGLAVFDANTGESRPLGEDLSRAKLAPDGGRLLAVRGGGLAVVDIATGQSTFVQTTQPPDQIAWDGGDTAYYSTRTLTAEPVPLSPEEAAALSAYLGVENATLTQYTVNLYRVSLSGGDTLVYSGPGWAVGRLFSAGGAVYFSLVPNGEAWVEALAAGLLDAASPDRWQQERRTVAVRLYRLNGDGSAVEVGADIGQAVPNPQG